MVNGLVWVQRTHCISHNRDDVWRIYGRAHEQYFMECEPRQIDFRLGLRIYAEVVGVSYDPNHWNLVWMRAKYSEEDVGTYRTPSCQIPLSESTVHDEGIRFVLDVFLLEYPAFLQRKAQRLEKTGTDIANRSEEHT